MINVLLLASSLLAIVASVVAHEWAPTGSRARRVSFVLLLAGGVGLRLLAARLDPYLNLWDEQFHALVAKNLISDPLRPTLYARPLLPFDVGDWTQNHVWLHKQPLFLWQIALSLRVFGVNEFAVRLPSVVLATAVLAMIQRVGTLTINSRAGFYAALLAASGPFGLDLVSGHALTDHNDVAFLFYVAASLWAWFEMSRSRRWRWAVAVGAFAGLAVLVKWLTGLLVFAGWAVALIASRHDRRDPRSWGRLAMAFVLAVAVVLPWQIYILRAFPEEARREYAHTTRHLDAALEGHQGDVWFHWRALRDLYGNSPLVPPLVAGSLLLLALRVQQRDRRAALVTWVVVTYAFFTTATTKMTAYCYPISPIVYLALGATLEDAVRWLSRRADMEKAWIVRTLALSFVLVMVWSMTARELAWSHLDRKLEQKPYRAVRTHDAAIIRRLSEILPPGRDWAVFNCREHEGILVMFHTPYTGYHSVPTIQQLAILQARGISVAVFDAPDLPEYVARNRDVFKIRPSVWDGRLGQVRRVTN